MQYHNVWYLSSKFENERWTGIPCKEKSEKKIIYPMDKKKTKRHMNRDLLTVPPTS